MKKNKYFSLLIAFVALLLILVGCGNNTLDTPKNISVDINNRLSWDKVTNARSYELEIKSKDEDNEFEKTYNIRKNYYLLDSLSEGDYEIRIKAYGDIEKTVLSDWSEIFEFHRDYENGCTYKLINNNSEYQVSSGRGVKNSKIEIPSTYRGKPVVEIATNAFKGNGYIEEIVIADSVKTIGDNAFYNCGGLQKITLPNNLESLGHAAFQSCKKLKTITLPDTLEVINEGTFTYCYELQSVKLPKNLKEIGEQAFDHCLKLESIKIPDTVETMGINAFSGNSVLKEANIPASLSILPEKTFSSCISLSKITFSSGSKLTEIGANAFYNCKLSSIEIPEGVTNIGDEAFGSNSELSEVKLPSSLIEVGSKAFNNTKIVSNQITEGKALAYVDNWVVYLNNQVDVKILGNNNKDGAVNFEDGVVGIADYVFAGYSVITSIIAPSTLKTIGKASFASCTSLYNLKLRQTEYILDNAFSNCTKLSIYDFGKSLKTIGNYAFYGCTLLNRKTIQSADNVKDDNTLPDTLTKIGTRAFEKTAFWNEANSDLIYVGNWIVGYNESKGGKNVSIQDGTRGIADYVFYKNSTIVNLSGIGRVSYIGYGAFYKCIGIYSVTLGDKIKKIEDFTFYGCTSLNQVIFNSNIESLGYKAFYGCNNLEVLDFSGCERLEKISDYSFYNCTNLNKVTFSDSIKEIGVASFGKCTNLSEIVLFDSITKLGERAFYNCTSLKKLTIGSGLTKISDKAFYGNESLEELIIPSTVTEVGANAFYNCKGIKKLVLSEGLTKIGAYAFFGLENLEDLRLPLTLNYIDKFAFAKCNKIKNIILSDNIKTINQHAFFGCTSASIYTNLSAEDVSNYYNWHTLFNSSRVSVVYGAELSSDISYVVSFTINKNNVVNFNEKKLLVAPVREGYTFGGWSVIITDEEGKQKEETLNVEELLNLADDTKVSVIWNKEV